MSMSRLKLHRSALVLLALVTGACAAKTADSASPETPEAGPAGDEPAADAAKDADAEDEEKSDEKADEKDAADAKDEAPAAKGGGDVLSILGSNPKTRSFSEVVLLSDFGKGMHGTEGAGFTVLAPTEEAMARLGKGAVERMKKHPAEADAFVRLHVVLGTNDANKLANFRTAPTAAGKDIEVKTQDSDMFVQGAKVIEADLKGSNGVVHLVDRVISLKKGK